MKAMKYSLLLVSALLCFSMNGAVNADGFQADNNDACTSIIGKGRRQELCRWRL